MRDSVGSSGADPMQRVILSAVTFFDNTDERVGVGRMPARVDNHAKGGVHGLFTWGTKGEAALLARCGVPVGRTRPPLAWGSETEIDALAGKTQVRVAGAGIAHEKGAR